MPFFSWQAFLAKVIKRLRALGEPAKLFGEDELARRMRLDAAARTRAHAEESDLMAGVQNDFLRDTTRLQKAGESF